MKVNEQDILQCSHTITDITLTQIGHVVIELDSYCVFSRGRRAAARSQCQASVCPREASRAPQGSLRSATNKHATAISTLTT